MLRRPPNAKMWSIIIITLIAFIALFNRMAHIIDSLSNDLERGMYRTPQGLDISAHREIYPPGSKEFAQFMKSVFNIYDQHRLQYNGHTEYKKFVKNAQNMHYSIEKRIPQFSPPIYNGNGYVVIGNRQTYWYIYSLLKVLESLKCKFPLEVIIPTHSEYDPYFCERILPQANMNAKCVLVPDVFKFELITKYNLLSAVNLEIIALLTSSFEKALFLETNNYPVNSIDFLFTDSDMIIWPDEKQAKTPGIFLKIQGGHRLNLNDMIYLEDGHLVKRKRIEVGNSPGNRERALQLGIIERNYQDLEMEDVSIDGGQILVNKGKHLQTLLLALWYNIEGDDKFYSLLSEKPADEIDDATKLRTIPIASNYLMKKCYRIPQRPQFITSLSRIITPVRVAFDLAMEDQHNVDFQSAPLFYHLQQDFPNIMYENIQQRRMAKYRVSNRETAIDLEQVLRQVLKTTHCSNSHSDDDHGDVGTETISWPSRMIADSLDIDTLCRHPL